MAATAPPVIQVHAQFPRTISLDTDLDINPSNWHWVHSLDLPIEKLSRLQLSQKPFKWIRYAIGAITGMHGHLSFSLDSLDIINYDAGFPSKSVILYYHTSNDEKQRIFPVDPNIAHSNITSSCSSTQRAGFHDKAAERDKWQCVLTGFPQIRCEAAHLLPHSKGDNYISMYTQHRSRDPTRNDVVQNINSVQNGLFLNKFTHPVVGQHVGFLVTPNFAMDTADINPSVLQTEKWYTTHLFEPDPLHLGDSALSSGSLLHILGDQNEWPPDIIFDLVYASAVLHHFATEQLKGEINHTFKDIFYPGGVMTAAQVEHKAKHREHYKHCCASQDAPDCFDMLMILPYVKVPSEQLRAVFREAQEKRAEREQKHVEEKVMAWAEDVASASGPEHP